MNALAIILTALVWFAASAGVANRGWLPSWAAYPLLGLLALGILNIADLGLRGHDGGDGVGPMLAILFCVLLVYNSGAHSHER